MTNALLSRPPVAATSYPATLDAAGGDLEGRVERLSLTAARLRCRGRLPEAGEVCRLLLHLPAGPLTAEVRVASVDPGEAICELELTRVEGRGLALLVALLLL